VGWAIRLPLPLTERSVYLCVEMQRIFSAEGPWPTPWMDKVLPVATTSRIAIAREIFSPASFRPSPRSDVGHLAALLHAPACCDRERLDLQLLDLMPR
jgi:hypothetical protein